MQISRSRGAGWAVAVVAAAALIVPVAGGIAAATQASAVPAQLVGQWSRNVTKAELHKYGQYAELPGVWTMVITTAGAANFFAPVINTCCAYPDVTMHITVAGTSLTFARGNSICTTKGTYTGKVSGRSLALKVIADKCPLRIAVFTGVWKRK